MEISGVYNHAEAKTVEYGQTAASMLCTRTRSGGSGYCADGNSGSARRRWFPNIKRTITRSDHNGNVLEQIEAVRASTAGKLQPSDSFPQSSYVRWTTYQYTDCCLLGSMRVYHTMPADGEGTVGTHYDQRDFGYDSTKQRNRSVSPGGTITFQVFDVHRRVIATYVGTDDSGASEADPSMQTHFLQQIQ